RTQRAQQAAPLRNRWVAQTRRILPRLRSDSTHTAQDAVCAPPSLCLTQSAGLAHLLLVTRYLPLFR
ncbi:MAG: hypothetical protein ACRD18_17820, partial [Terriglobia bacterium]